jgi:hypothetical protein
LVRHPTCHNPNTLPPGFPLGTALSFACQASAAL